MAGSQKNENQALKKGGCQNRPVPAWCSPARWIPEADLGISGGATSNSEIPVTET